MFVLSVPSARLGLGFVWARKIENGKASHCPSRQRQHGLHACVSTSAGRGGQEKNEIEAEQKRDLTRHSRSRPPPCLHSTYQRIETGKEHRDYWVWPLRRNGTSTFGKEERSKKEREIGEQKRTSFSLRIDLSLRHLPLHSIRRRGTHRVSVPRIHNLRRGRSDCSGGTTLLEGQGQHCGRTSSA